LRFQGRFRSRLLALWNLFVAMGQAQAQSSARQQEPAGVVMQDPRRLGGHVSVLGFYYPDRMEPCDVLCGVQFLSNFWTLPEQLQLCAASPGKREEEHYFFNAEAAFQALKFWDVAEQFSGLRGDEAFTLKRKLAGKEDFSYAGMGSNWKAMDAVLRAKFKPRSQLTERLLGTNDAYLLEHNSVTGRDQQWSDNSDGEGTNWLGLQLMILREEYRGLDRPWTTWLIHLINLNTGKGRSNSKQEIYRNSVREARNALVAKLCGDKDVSGHAHGGGGASSGARGGEAHLQMLPPRKGHSQLAEKDGLQDQSCSWY